MVSHPSVQTSCNGDVGGNFQILPSISPLLEWQFFGFCETISPVIGNFVIDIPEPFQTYFRLRLFRVSGRAQQMANYRFWHQTTSHESFLGQDFVRGLDQGNKRKVATLWVFPETTSAHLRDGWTD